MAEVQAVDVVFKTHLDLGFTGLASEVTDRYLQHFIPAAMDLAAELRRRDGPERFVWTTGSWLLHTALERGDAAMRARLEAAIEAGDLVWHALPFTLHSELCDVPLFEFGLSISARLDERFGKRTVAAKFTDVPGHTRGIVPLLAAAGVELLHIGVNPASTPPDVPDVFRWRSPDGSEITVVYQRGGYGDLTVVDGCDHALAFAHSGDNLGPPSADDVIAAFAALCARVPGADVRASTLDAFTEAMSPVIADLPVVTAEIGDTWIHGIGSDPTKVARFRALLRRRDLALRHGDLLQAADHEVGEALLLVAEHTWGMDEKTFLPDLQHWDRDGLAALREDPATVRFESSWAEQRGYLDRAEAALHGSASVRPAHAPSRSERAADPRPGWAAVDGVVAIESEAFRMAVDTDTGAIVELTDRRDGRELASAAHPLGWFRYQTFDESDYQRWHDGYNCAGPDDEWWAVLDFTKPGIDAAGAQSRWWAPHPARARLSPDGRCIEVELAGHPEAVSTFGCPPSISVTHTLLDRHHVQTEVRWSEKPACRLPEALWFSYVPLAPQPEGWLMTKLGQPVRSTDVVRHGGRHLHASGQARHIAADGYQLGLDSADAPLLAPGEPALLRFDGGPLDPAGGLHVCLGNNVWGTNFPMWIEGDAAFRFSLSAGEVAAPPTTRTARRG